MAIDPTKMIRPATAVLAPVGGTLSEAWAAVIGDRTAAWRLKNAAALQVKVNRELAALGVQLDRSKIPERYAIAWFEEATKQDEPEIQILFARLLAKASAGDENASDRRLLDIVGRLTPFDAKVLQWVFELSGPPPRHPQVSEYEAWREAKKKFGDGAALSLEHIVLLGIFEKQYSIRNEGGMSSWYTLEPGTPLGSLADYLTGDLSVIPDLSASAIGLALYSACFGSAPTAPSST